MKINLTDRAYQLEVRAAQDTLIAALGEVEMAIRAIRAEIDRGKILPGQGRRLVTDSAEVLQHLTTLATLATCRPLIDKSDQG